MNDMDKQIESLKKDYLAQQFPGNLGELVSSESANRLEVSSVPSNSKQIPHRFRVVLALSAMLLSGLLWLGSRYLLPAAKDGSKTALSSTNGQRHVPSIRPNESIPTSTAAKPLRIKVRTMSLSTVIHSSTPSNLVSKPLPALGLFLTRTSNLPKGNSNKPRHLFSKKPKNSNRLSSDPAGRSETKRLDFAPNRKNSFLALRPAPKDHMSKTSLRRPYKKQIPAQLTKKITPKKPLKKQSKEHAKKRPSFGALAHTNRVRTQLDIEFKQLRSLNFWSN